ncbi:hypothetical protein SPLC1_S033610 [Arthrospira platensis C1]|nr:hypothetical protein SPLC1_S033610 [Arthrospira platensis C1]
MADSSYNPGQENPKIRGLENYSFPQFSPILTLTQHQNKV